jgi:hypothetical protein
MDKLTRTRFTVGVWLRSPYAAFTSLVSIRLRPSYRSTLPDCTIFRAPWEIRRRDLGAEPIRSIVERLHRTGKLILQGVARRTSLPCSLKIKEMIMPGILSEGSESWSSPRCGARR